MDTATSTTGSDFGPVQFPPTRWSLVLAARADPERAERAIGELCERYRDAIAGWFKCRRRDDASDLAQHFIQRWLTANRLRNVRPREGSRFRFYLAAALNNFLRDQIERERAGKRGGGAPHLSMQGLGEQGFELPSLDPVQPSTLDGDITLRIHQNTLAGLERTAREPSRFQRFSRFIPFEQGDATYVQTAQDLGLKEGAVRTAVSRLRDDYFEAFRAEVIQMTPGGPAEANEETRYLLELLAIALERQAAGGGTP